MAVRPDRQFRRGDPGADRDGEGGVLPAGQQVVCSDEQDEGAAARDGEAQGALRRGPPAHEPGADAALSPREGEPGRRLSAHRRADPGVLRALQGALHHDRDAPSAVLRLDQGSERARSAHHPDRLRPVPLGHPAVPALLQHRPVAHRHGRHDVPAAEAEPGADRSRAGARVPVPADPVHLHAGFVRGRPGDLLGVEQHAVDRPAVHDHAPPRHAAWRQAQAGGRRAAGPGSRRRWGWRWRKEGRQGLVQEGLMDDQETRGRTPAEIEAARKLFAGTCEFIAGAASFESLPSIVLPEVAFAGRSNVGKSSLVNALTGRRTLARVSASPGATRQINFFDLAGRFTLVDLPGYGFARVSKSTKEIWQDLASAYLRGRPTLKRVCLLIDSRHGVKDSDHETMKNLDKAAVSYQLVLTKTDRLRTADVPRAIAAAEAAIRKHGASHPEVLPTSSETGFGIVELRAEIAAAATG